MAIGPNAHANFTAQLQNVYSGQCVEVVNAGSGDGVNVHHVPCVTNRSHQRLEFEPIAGQANTYTLAFAHSGKCLDVTAASSQNGANVQQLSCHGGSGQRFTLVDRGGEYTLYTNNGSNQVLDLHVAVDNIIQWQDWGNANQRWRLVNRVDEGNNVDSDGDGVPDSSDAFPNDPDETTDSDGDGIGDNADPTPNGEPAGGGTPISDFTWSSSSTGPNTRDEAQYVVDARDTGSGKLEVTVEINLGGGPGDNDYITNPWVQLGSVRKVLYSGRVGGQGATQKVPYSTMVSFDWPVGSVDLSVGYDNYTDTSWRTETGKGGESYSAGMIGTGGSTPPATDSDGDGIADTSDNCPNNSNSDQLNSDSDAQGNACDPDDDNDTVEDGLDAFPLNPGETSDTDGDGIGDNADTTPNGGSTAGGFSAQLQNVSSGQCVEVVNAVSGDGVNVHHVPCVSNRSHQRLNFEPVAGQANTYTLAFAHSGKCLDVAGASSQNGTNVQQLSCHGGSGQRFTLVDRGGEYTIYTNNGSNQVLDLYVAIDNIIQWQDWGNANQRWRLYGRVDGGNDSDSDGDGVPDSSDAFPNNPGETTDSDGDSIGDVADNCPSTSNSNQLNGDSDTAGDVCDSSPGVLSDGAPAQSAFYQPPTVLDGDNGDVLWAEEISAADNGRIWKVLYQSQDLHDNPIGVSGWLAVPNSPKPASGYPIVSFAHGTTGLADSCAPTRRSTPEETIALMEEFLAQGFVVAATDYQGLGTPGVHHYLIGPSEGRSVLDAARAARQVAGASNEVILLGHSQGGHAVIFANEIAASYAADLDILGTISSGSAISGTLGALVEATKTSSFKGYLVMAGVAQTAAYGEQESPLSRWLTPYGIQAAASLESICVDQLVATYGALGSSTLFVDGAPLPPSTGVYDIEGDTTPGRRLGSSPMLMLHGRNDNQVPPSFLLPWVESTCALGQAIQLEWFNTGHRVPYEAPQLASPVVFNWIADRFAGRAAASSCSAVPQP